MPKARTRKKRITRSGPAKKHRSTTAVASVSASEVPSALTQVPVPAYVGAQQLPRMMMAGMVALGCWGLAAYNLFIMMYANHYLLGSLAALFAIIWSVLFGVRLRKWQQKR